MRKRQGDDAHQAGHLFLEREGAFCGEGWEELVGEVSAERRERVEDQHRGIRMVGRRMRVEEHPLLLLLVGQHSHAQSDQHKGRSNTMPLRCLRLNPLERAKDGKGRSLGGDLDVRLLAEAVVEGAMLPQELSDLRMGFVGGGSADSAEDMIHKFGSGLGIGVQDQQSCFKRGMRACRSTSERILIDGSFNHMEIHTSFFWLNR